MATLRKLILVPLIALVGCGGGGSYSHPEHAKLAHPCVSLDGLPDSTCQPGLASQSSGRCHGTSSVRPPTSYTNSLKRKQIVEYGFKDTNTADYEEDHLVALAVGGDPKSPKNLWPEPRYGKWNASVKDRLEYYLYRQVCSGKLDAKTAQLALSQDWVKSYQKYQPGPTPFAQRSQ